MAKHLTEEIIYTVSDKGIYLGIEHEAYSSMMVLLKIIDNEPFKGEEIKITFGAQRLKEMKNTWGKDAEDVLNKLDKKEDSYHVDLQKISTADFHMLSHYATIHVGDYSIKEVGSKDGVILFFKGVKEEELMPIVNSMFGSFQIRKISMEEMKEYLD